MKLWRKMEMESERIEVGDQIRVELPGETHNATAIQIEEDGALFLFDDCLDEPMPMNRGGGAEGGYDESDLREYLQKVAKGLPKELREWMVPFENGDLLRLLTLKEACGCDADYEDCDGQIPWMKDRQHRITAMKDDEYAYWWLRDPVSAADFTYVDYNGNADNHGAGNSFGVRPAFKIRNHQSPPLVGGEGYNIEKEVSE